MTIFQSGIAVGALIASLLWLVVPFLARELRYRRTRPVLRGLTVEHREDSRRTARLLAGSGAVRTPVPFQPLRAKGAR